MNKTEDAALQRLLKIASSNTGQSRRVANFILAWWNATDHGGFDLAEIFAVDEAIADDMRTVFAYLSYARSSVRHACMMPSIWARYSVGPRRPAARQST